MDLETFLLLAPVVLVSLAFHELAHALVAYKLGDPTAKDEGRITLNPPTPVETIWPAIELVDVVLVMSVMPGFGGQKFMPEVLPKAEAIKNRLRPDQRLEIDGGIHSGTIAQARRAGIDWFVVGSGIFDTPDRAAAIRELRSKL